MVHPFLLGFNQSAYGLLTTFERLLLAVSTRLRQLQPINSMYSLWIRLNGKSRP